jgi:hypothetical protein
MKMLISLTLSSLCADRIHFTQRPYNSTQNRTGWYVEYTQTLYRETWNSTALQISSTLKKQQNPAAAILSLSLSLSCMCAHAHTHTQNQSNQFHDEHVNKTEVNNSNFLYIWHSCKQNRAFWAWRNLRQVQLIPGTDTKNQYSTEIEILFHWNGVQALDV